MAGCGEHQGISIAGFLYSKLPYDPLNDSVGVATSGNAGYVVAPFLSKAGLQMMHIGPSQRAKRSMKCSRLACRR